MCVIRILIFVTAYRYRTAMHVQTGVMWLDGNSIWERAAKIIK